MDSITKICTKCRVSKNTDDFYADRRRVGGKMSACKSCHCKSSKTYHETHKERYKELKHNYHINHRDSIIEKVKKWAKDNTEKYNSAKLLWNHSNAEKRREITRKGTKKWRVKNPDKVRLLAIERRFREKGAGGVIKKEEWNSLLMDFGNKCLSCGRSDMKITIDHIVPLKLGGKNTIDNVQPLCQSCNSKKGLKIIDYRPNFFLDTMSGYGNIRG